MHSHWCNSHITLNYLLELVSDSLDEIDLGLEGKVTPNDETLLGIRKYNRDHRSRWSMCFSGRWMNAERNVFLRSLSIISALILGEITCGTFYQYNHQWTDQCRSHSGSSIAIDCWSGYNPLEGLGYTFWLNSQWNSLMKKVVMHGHCRGYE